MSLPNTDRKHDSATKDMQLGSGRNPVVEPTAPKQVSFINLSEMQRNEQRNEQLKERNEQIKEKRKPSQQATKQLAVTTFNMEVGTGEQKPANNESVRHSKKNS